jgi:hypothetical protein
MLSTALPWMPIGKIWQDWRLYDNRVLVACIRSRKRHGQFEGQFGGHNILLSKTARGRVEMTFADTGRMVGEFDRSFPAPMTFTLPNQTSFRVNYLKRGVLCLTDASSRTLAITTFDVFRSPVSASFQDINCSGGGIETWLCALVMMYVAIQTGYPNV